MKKPIDYKGYTITDYLRNEVLNHFEQDDNKYIVYIQGTTKAVASANTIAEAKEEIDSLIEAQDELEEMYRFGYRN